MKEQTKKALITIVLIIVFIISVLLVVRGRMNVGVTGLLTQFAGLAGLLFLLWNYNRRYR